MIYERANTEWFSRCRYGLGIHWTAQATPRRGPPLPFPKAVETFNVASFVEFVKETGADYVLFTTVHALQWMPAPNRAIDKILPGRTCARDLLKEITDGLAKSGIHMIFYYNHSCNLGEDPAWEQAIGYHDKDKSRLVDNLCSIVSWMGQHYGTALKGWWFDSSYSLDSRGPHNSVTTEMGGFLFPWERFTVAAKEGYPQRLVTYNAGVNEYYLYTDYQDYWAGEMVDLDHPPQGHFAENGLQWHGWFCLDDRGWIHAKLNTDLPGLLYSDEQVIAFVRKCNRYKAPITLGIGVYQDGSTSPQILKQMKKNVVSLSDGYKYSYS